jgi:hypothetical protein
MIPNTGIRLTVPAYYAGMLRRGVEAESSRVEEHRGQL